MVKLSRRLVETCCFCAVHAEDRDDNAEDTNEGVEEEEEYEKDIEADVDDNEKEDEQGKETEGISCGASKFTDRPEAEVDNNDEEEVTLAIIVVGILSQSTVVVVLQVLVLLVAIVVIIFDLISLIISEEYNKDDDDDDEDIVESESLEEILNEFENLPGLFVESLSLIQSPLPGTTAFTLRTGTTGNIFEFDIGFDGGIEDDGGGELEDDSLMFSWLVKSIALGLPGLPLVRPPLFVFIDFTEFVTW